MVLQGRKRRPRLVGAVLGLGALAVLILVSVAGAAFPSTASPSFIVTQIIAAPPADGTIKMGDNEGSAYVPNTGVANNTTPSLWIAEDNQKSLWELNATTGALKSRVKGTPVNGTVHIDWSDARPWSTSTGSIDAAGLAPTEANYNDLEGLAYDATADKLYVFSGSTGGGTRTVFRLSRGSDGTFHPDAYQALPGPTFTDPDPTDAIPPENVPDATAAAWNPADGKLYVGFERTIRQYVFATNTLGNTPNVDRWTIPGSVLGGTHGMTFDSTGSELIAVWGVVPAPATTPHNVSALFRINWPANPASARTAVTGWTNVDLTPLGILDARSVEVINDKLYIGDGADPELRAANDPNRYATFVVTPCCASGTAVTANFTSSQLPSPALTMQLTDSSSGGSSNATSWAWDFGDGQTSTSQNPSHTYSAAGTYTVKLVATNAAGFSTPKLLPVTVTGPIAASFTSAQASSPALTINFTDTSTGGATAWLWSFGDGQTSTLQSPPHTYAAADTYNVTLTASKPGASATSTQPVTVTASTGGGGGGGGSTGGGGGGGGSGVMPDTELSVTADRLSAAVGESFTLSASVRLKNQLVSSGGGNLTLTYALPANVDLVSVTTDRGICAPPGRTVSCNLDFIANVLVPHVTIVVKVTGAGEIVNALTAKTDEPDPDPTNNAVTVKINAPTVTPPTVSAPPKPSAPFLPPVGLKRKGTLKADVIRGTKGPDQLDGLAGNDRIFGYAGKDVLTGGKGKDVILAGLGNDQVNVRDGEIDTVNCGAGIDTVIADKTDKLTSCEKVKRK